ncbi:hypothetical protein EHN43_10830 [Salmonella enterica]|nr:hypothetical protein [Salmonella enterica]EGV8386159.1 hypothetical protein [Salmonella enterica]
MGKLTELEQWDEDIYQIETSDPVLGGPEGLSNRPQKQLANRTQWLKKQLEDANNALAEHEKSRNHPDATLTDKGFVKLYSGVTSMDETMAATPKAVKIAMDNANERLAKARNLADLQSVPLALANLTLANVKKYVESTNTGVSKLPQFRPSSEDDLTSLPAGYMALVKNSTPGGPLPDENWFYLEVAGNLDNSSNNPNRKGAVIRLIQVSTPEISWTGVKFDDGTTTTAKFRWSRDFNTLNKPTPEDVGLAATKKAVDDTQTGLAAQPVMWISTVDDLSNLPSGARRFACNKAPATVLPAAGYFFLEVLSKRDVANGSCILATSDAGNVWIGLRYTAPTDTAFTWIQLNQNVENLGLTEAVKKALNAVQKNGDTMSAPLVNTHPDAFRLKQPGRSFFWRFDGTTLYLLRTAINDPDGGWDGARPLYVNADTGLVFLGPDTKINGTLYVGDARVHTNGNIYGIAWGGWLSDYLNIQFTARDNNINARATTAWVNQYFATKNTGSLAQTGWFKDSSTGLIIQWGEVGRTGYGTWVNFPISFPALCSAVFLTLSDSPVSLNNSTQNIHANSRTVSGFNYAANTAESSAFWLAIGR